MPEAFSSNGRVDAHRDPRREPAASLEGGEPAQLAQRLDVDQHAGGIAAQLPSDLPGPAKLMSCAADTGIQCEAQLTGRSDIQAVDQPREVRPPAQASGWP